MNERRERDTHTGKRMPIGNNFKHADYTRADPKERVSYGEVHPAAGPDSSAWIDAMASHGVRLSNAGVRAVVFVHGTYRGTDLFGMQRLDEAGGLKRGYSRGIAGLDALLALMREDTNGLGAPPGGRMPPLLDDEETKQAIDGQVGDAANYTTDYVAWFEKGVNRDASRPIACSRHVWSAEHHHLGRAKAVCLLIQRLRALATDLSLGPGDRVLVQAHGHTGQLMALLSNLLAPGDSSGRKTFLTILTSYLEQTGDAPHVLESVKAFDGAPASGKMLNDVSVDVVTFGTPVRYGWDPSGIGRLLHVVNHRMMRQDGKRWLAKTELPQITMEMPIAWGGDYVQQLGVAGCDAAPATPEAKEGNKALWELLEPWDGFERWLECARKSVRCQNDSHCLLVDYKDSTGSTEALEHLYGHAAYTRLDHLLFNTGEIVQALYPSPPHAG